MNKVSLEKSTGTKFDGNWEFQFPSKTDFINGFFYQSSSKITIYVHVFLFVLQ